MRGGSQKEGQSGATIVECVIILPLLFFLILAFFDVCRYFYVLTVLTDHASRAMNVARKISNFDINPRGLDINSRQYFRFEWARNEIVKEGTQTLSPYMIAPVGSNYDTVLMEASQDDGIQTFRSGVLILRPGECGFMEGQEVCNIRSLGFKMNEPRPKPKRFRELMRYHLVHAHMWAKMRPFTPFMPTIIIKGMSVGLREDVHEAHVPGEGERFGNWEPLPETTTPLPPQPPRPATLAQDPLPTVSTCTVSVNGWTTGTWVPDTVPRSSGFCSPHSPATLPSIP